MITTKETETQVLKTMTVKEVAELFHVNVRTLQKQAQSGYYPTTVCGRLGRHYLFNLDKLLQFVFPDKSAIN